MKYGVSKSFTEKRTFEQRLKVSERISYVDMWGEDLLGTEKNTCKALGMSGSSITEEQQGQCGQSTMNSRKCRKKLDQRTEGTEHNFVGSCGGFVFTLKDMDSYASMLKVEEYKK